MRTIWTGMLLLLLAACGEESYHYPSVRLEFMTAIIGEEGRVASVLTDDGVLHAVMDDRSGILADADTFVRIVSNYESIRDADGNEGVRLYAALSTISPVPKPRSEFKGDIKTDPVELQSIWLGKGYLNLLLGVKAQSGKHQFHFIEEEKSTDEASGCVTVKLRLYHDAADDVEAYTKRAYLSIPLWSYTDGKYSEVKVRFLLETYSAGEKEYTFDYLSENLKE